MRLVTSLAPLAPAVRKAFLATAVAALAVALGACSASRQNYQGASWAGAQPPAPVPQRQAAYEPDPNDPIKDAPIEPVRRAQPAPDDPSEPFSPNYGGARTRPTVKVSDASAPVRDPEPEQVGPRKQVSQQSRAYYRRAAPVATTASAD